MNLFEKIVDCYQKGQPIPLKGHTKITLTDVYTGKEEIHESDNMVTNAVADILSKNICGLARYASIFPLKNLFSGVLGFADALEEDPDNYNPPAENVSSLTFHAGTLPNTTASTLRGSPNEGETVVTDTSVKFVWDFSTNQGNGPISTICLCPGTRLGNMGLKPFDATINPMYTFGNDTVYSSAWNTDVAKQYPFTISEDGKSGMSVYLSGDTFTEHEMRHDYLAFGIMRDSRTWQLVASRSATVRTGSNRFIVDDDDYYYVIRASSATALQIDKISKDDFTVTQADMIYANVSLFTGTINGHPEVWRTFAFDGEHLYYPNSAGTGFYRLSLTDNDDKDALDGTIIIDKGNLSDPYVSGDQFSTPIVISKGLVLGSNYIINGNNVYQIKRTSALGSQVTYLGRTHFVDIIRIGAACYGHSKQQYANDYWTGQSNVLVEMFLSTINVLENAPIFKEPTQTMKIEYTIAEGTPNP